MTAMKKILFVIAALASFMTGAQAQKISDVAVSDLKVLKDGDEMNITMNIDLSQLDVKNRRSVHLLPVIKNGADSLELAPVGVYSRGRYINYLRKGESIFEDLGEDVYKEGKEPKMLNYAVTVPYKSWMDGSEVVMHRMVCGCCEDLIGEESKELGGFSIPVFDPQYKFLRPEAELVKMRELSGTAFVDFVVSRTEINPEYRNNKVELAKIIATIDSVKNDADIKVKSVFLKGFASPESPYSNNERLAKGRTAALKDYVKGLYDFPEDTFITSYEPENWADLRVFVENSDLPTKEKIIALIDSDLEPDYKEFTIKTEYPDEYSYLLGVCYPALRKTDYLIEYSIDVYTDVEEIVRIFRTAPSKLSLNELYVASTQFEPGSEDFVKVFETAVQMYPNDPVANLNAANVAMADGNFRQADKYLDKAGDSPEATYARGIFYTATGSYNEAEAAFKAAKAAGIMEADDMLKECAELKAYYAENR